MEKNAETQDFAEGSREKEAVIGEQIKKYWETKLKRDERGEKRPALSYYQLYLLQNFLLN